MKQWIWYPSIPPIYPSHERTEVEALSELASDFWRAGAHEGQTLVSHAPQELRQLRRGGRRLGLDEGFLGREDGHDAPRSAARVTAAGRSVCEGCHGWVGLWRIVRVCSQGSAE